MLQVVVASLLWLHTVVPPLQLSPTVISMQPSLIILMKHPSIVPIGPTHASILQTLLSCFFTLLASSLELIEWTIQPSHPICENACPHVQIGLSHPQFDHFAQIFLDQVKVSTLAY